MTQRFICPHCHSPLDPHSMEQASSGDALLRVCPNCDEPVVLQPAAALVTRNEQAATTPARHAPSATR